MTAESPEPDVVFVETRLDRAELRRLVERHFEDMVKYVVDVQLGVAAVIAESFGRIYFRNCVAIAFPNLACPGIADACEEGDELEVDVGSGRVANLTRSTELRAQPYTGDMLQILEQGGLIEVLKRRAAGAVA